MKIGIYAGLLFVWLLAPSLLASTDLSLLSSDQNLTYTENADSINQDFSVRETSFSVRGNSYLASIFDLGVEAGSFTHSQQFLNQSVDIEAQQFGILTGITFPIFVDFIEINLDLGLKFSVHDLAVSRNESSDSQKTIFQNKKNASPILRIGLKTVVSASFLLGIAVENSETSFKASNSDLQTETFYGQSTIISIGYRFGGKKMRGKPESRKIHDTNCYKFGRKECLRFSTFPFY